jgi:hypothetical protein
MVCVGAECDGSRRSWISCAGASPEAEADAAGALVQRLQRFGTYSALQQLVMQQLVVYLPSSQPQVGEPPSPPQP